MRKAEEIACLLHGKTRIAVIAGIGTRNYYRKLGYRLRETFLIKEIRRETHGNPSLEAWLDCRAEEMESVPVNNQELAKQVIAANPTPAGERVNSGNADPDKYIRTADGPLGAALSKRQLRRQRANKNRDNPLNPKSPFYDPELAAAAKAAAKERKKQKEEEKEEKEKAAAGVAAAADGVKQEEGNQEEEEKKQEKQQKQQEKEKDSSGKEQGGTGGSGGRGRGRKVSSPPPPPSPPSAPSVYSPTAGAASSNIITLWMFVALLAVLFSYLYSHTSVIS